ncbi:M81 family metallopeptidase [Paenibacillus sp. GCM10027626]|uniref:M81 family metallopeptidase n=1 Tax=Paenibacillus sp. GCM10027626 TaxID=3273411 RepID=UPI00363E6A1F
MMERKMANNKVRIAVCGILHETNTFAPGRTTLADFKADWHAGDAFLERYTGTRTSMGGVIDATQKDGLELVPGLYTYTTPSGMVTSETLDALERELVDSIAADADGIVMILHGAMVAESCFDVEGRLIRTVRNRFGSNVPIAVTLDLHANITPEMVEAADIYSCYDTYPHIDAYERAIDAVNMLAAAIRGEVKPVLAWSAPGMVVVPQAMLTSEGAMKELMDEAAAIEADPQVLKVTVAGGFPYSDVPYAGMSFIVVADGSQEVADKYAQQLKAWAWNNRHRFITPIYSVQEALQAAYAEEEGPVVLTEASDNVGGGAPADGTFLLAELVNAPRKSLIVIRDEEEARKAYALGAGAAFAGEIGGKSDKLHGDPVKVSAVISQVSDGKYRHVGAYMTGQHADMGRTAVLETGNLTIILTENRVAPWDVAHVTSVGLDPGQFHIIVAKSAIAWKTAFGDLAKKAFDVDTPGCCSALLSHFEYKHLNKPLYPFDIA